MNPASKPKRDRARPQVGARESRFRTSAFPWLLFVFRWRGTRGRRRTWRGGGMYFGRGTRSRSRTGRWRGCSLHRGRTRSRAGRGASCTTAGAPQALRAPRRVPPEALRARLQAQDVAPVQRVGLEPHALPVPHGPPAGLPLGPARALQAPRAARPEVPPAEPPGVWPPPRVPAPPVPAEPPSPAAPPPQCLAAEREQQARQAERWPRFRGPVTSGPRGAAISGRAAASVRPMRNRRRTPSGRSWPAKRRQRMLSHRRTLRPRARH